MVEGIVRLTCAKEKSNEWKDHLVTEFFIEEEHPKHDSYRYNAQNRHSPLDNFQDSPKFPDIARKLIDKMARETVGPEGVLALPERNLQPHTFRFMSIALEEVKGMFEGWRAALNSIIHPRSSVFGGIEGDGGSLSANYRHAFE